MISLEEDIEQTTKLINRLSVKEPDPQPEGWRDELEEVRRARTTSGTIHLASQEQKKETIPEGRKCIGRGGMTVSLNVPDATNINIINIGTSRSPVKDLISTFENIQNVKTDNHETSIHTDRKSKPGNVKKLAETFNSSSRNESSSDHPASRNIQLDGEQVPRKQFIPGKAKDKPPSSRRVWTRLKSGLFGWKKITSVSVPARPSQGKTLLSTHNKSKNFEVKSVAQNSENTPPKISVGGEGSSVNMQQVFRNNRNGEKLVLLAGNLSSEWKTKGQTEGEIETKKSGGKRIV